MYFSAVLNAECLLKEFSMSLVIFLHVLVETYRKALNSRAENGPHSGPGCDYVTYFCCSSPSVFSDIVWKNAVERNRKNVSGQLWQAFITIPLSLLHQTMPVC